MTRSDGVHSAFHISLAVSGSIRLYPEGKRRERFLLEKAGSAPALLLSLRSRGEGVWSELLALLTRLGDVHLALEICLAPKKSMRLSSKGRGRERPFLVPALRQSSRETPPGRNPPVLDLVLLLILMNCCTVVATGGPARLEGSRARLECSTVVAECGRERLQSCTVVPKGGLALPLPSGQNRTRTSTCICISNGTSSDSSSNTSTTPRACEASSERGPDRANRVRVSSSASYS